ncbi:MAG: antitoxin [Solirubrobacteraceae bacterium]
MGIADRLKDLKTKAVDATAERSDKIHEAVEKVASTADERTGGKYHDRIQKAGAKAGSLVDGLTGSEQQPGADSAAGAPADAAEGSEPVEAAGSEPAEATEAAPAADA